MTNFKIGQKVVCVNAKPTIGKTVLYIKEGNTYTIKNIHICSCGMEHISLIEINDNGGLTCGNCCGNCSMLINQICYMNIRFRPLIYNSATEEILEKFKLTEEKSDIQIKEQELVFAKK